MPLQAAFAQVDAADGEPPVNPKTLPVPGFVVKTCAMADSQKWFINCCAHEIVDRPLANGSMEPVDDTYLDSWNLANVQVPLHVCSKRTTVDHAGETSIAIDVVFNPALTKRATAPGSKAAGAFQEHMAKLALNHAAKEYGVRLDKHHKVIRATYKGGRGDGSLPVPIPELVAMEREQMARALGRDTPATAGAASAHRQQPPQAQAASGRRLVQEFDSWEEAERASVARKVGAKAQPARPAASSEGKEHADTRLAPPGGARTGGGPRAAAHALKSGFLNASAGALYPNGSTEGTPAKNAGDPLGWMPDKLRSRVQTVDTATMSDEEQLRLMRVHAGLEEDPKKVAARKAREKAAEEHKMWAQVKEALPSKEELDRIAKDTDPEEFLSELRLVSENMANAERSAGLAAAAAAGDAVPGKHVGAPREQPSVSFAKPGFLTNGSAHGSAVRPAAAPPGAAPPGHVAAREPQYTLSGESRELELLVKLPDVEHISALELDISAELVILRAPGDIELNLALPRRIDEDACEAKFSKKRRELRLTMPVR